MDFIKFIQAKHPAIEFMHSVTEDHAKQYFGHLQRNGKFDKHVTHKNDKNLSARTVNIYLTNLKQIFKELARDASIAVNPFAAIKKLSHKPAERDLFSDDELKKIWSNPDAFLEPLFQCSYNTGLREGDICTLRKDEIDLVDGDGWINRKTRKTGKDVEIPVFGDDFRAYLEQSIDWNSESPFAFPKLCTAYHKSREKIHRKLTAYFKALKITGTQTKDKKLSRATNRKGIHSLRHQFIYRACDSGIPIHVVQDIVGHESEAVTKIYAKHTSRADKEKHFRKMNGQANGDGYVRIRELVESMNGQNWMKAKAEILEVMK
jgi:integrase